MENTITDKIKFVAQMVEKFVEHNIVEKEQRDENLKKLATAFETFLRDNPIRQSIHRATGDSEQTKTMTLQVKKWDHYEGEMPRYQSRLASGFDVRAQVREEIVLQPGQRVLVPTGLSFAIPEGYELQARPRSGLAIRDGISLVNTPGTIDADYRGEVKIILINLGDKEVVIKDQDRIAQLVLCPVTQAKWEVVETLTETERGNNGFGSTGVRAN